MIRKLWMTALLCVALGLAACSSAGATRQASSGVLNANYDNALSVEMQLAFGTLKLEGTANAVSSESAAQLLPLWKAVRSLSASDAAAQEEIQAVYRQIEESLSADQLQAIAAMQLTTADMRQMAADMGLNTGAVGGPSGTPNASAQAASQSAQAAGQPPADFAAGGMPGGDPGGMPAPGSGGTSASTSSSASAGSASANPIVDAVISYLQGKLA